MEEIPETTHPPDHYDAEGGAPTELLKLANEDRVLIRSIRPSDKELLAAGFRSLSAESRYLRFFATVRELGEDDLAYLTEVDHRAHEALVAIEPSGGHILGVARYVRLADEPLADVAVVVHDSWQGRGLGTSMLRRLADRAREQGITHFVARMLPQNDKALALLHSAESVETRMLDDGKVEAVIELPEDSGIGPGLSTSLRAAAEGLLHGSAVNVLRGLLGHRSSATAPGDES